MDMRPLIEWAKRFRGFLGIVAFFLVVFLSVIIYLFKQGSFDQVLSNFGKLTGSQFLIIVSITLGFFFIIAVLLIFLSYKSTRSPQVGQGEDVIYVQVYDSVKKQRLGNAEVYWNLRGTKHETTNVNGEARFIFPSIYKGETCKIEAFKEGYQSKSAQVTLGKKPDIEFYLNPKRKEPTSSKLEEVTTQKSSDTSSNMDPQSQDKPIQIENTAITNSAMPDITSPIQIPDVEIETIQSKRHRLGKIKDSIRLLKEEGIKNSNVTTPSLKAKLEFEERNAAHIVPDTIFHFNEPLPNFQEYFGRARERTTLINRVGKGASTSIVGPRKIGKTWLLYYLQFVVNSHFGNQKRVCYVDASMPSCNTLTGFIVRIVEELGIFGANASQNLADLETIIRDLKSRNISPLVCIDEFEGFDNKQEFDLIFFKELRALTQIGLCLVVASKKPLIDIVGENGQTSGFFNVFEQLTLKPFTHQEADLFVEIKSRQAGFTDQERMRLLLYGQEEGKYYPMRLQLAGKMLLEDKNLAVQEGANYYRPDDLHYWQEFEEHLEEKYRGVVR